MVFFQVRDQPRLRRSPQRATPAPGPALLRMQRTEHLRNRRPFAGMGVVMVGVLQGESHRWAYMARAMPNRNLGEGAARRQSDRFLTRAGRLRDGGLVMSGTKNLQDAGAIGGATVTSAGELELASTLAKFSHDESTLQTAQQPIPAGPARYETVSVLGQGGMGRVLTALDKQFGRTVAIKEVLPEVAQGSARKRFDVEALVTANLEHPGIPAVHERGASADGRPFYVMRLVKGETLSAAIRSTRTLRDRMKLLPHVLKTVQTVAFAHERGVVHRDIKPENILVGKHGETVLLDWGIAKVRGVRDEQGHPTTESIEGMQTRDGAVMGTPAYMAPEQAAGDVDKIDERTDVFSLGALLYHVLTGSAPYAARSMPEAVTKAMLAQPDRPLRRAVPDVAPALELIVARAMAKAPEDRYQTAAELADALETFTTDSYEGKPSRAVHLFADASSALLTMFIVLGIVMLGILGPSFHEMGLPALVLLVLPAVGLVLSGIEWKTGGRYTLSPLVLVIAAATMLFGLAHSASGVGMIGRALSTPEVFASSTEFRRVLAEGMWEASGAISLGAQITLLQLAFWAVAKRRVERVRAERKTSRA